MTLSIGDTQYNNAAIMLIVIMLSVIMLSVVVLVKHFNLKEFKLPTAKQHNYNACHEVKNKLDCLALISH